MYNDKTLKHYIHTGTLSQKDIVLIALGVDECEPKTIPQIRKLLINAGKREAARWNLPSILSRADRLAIKTSDGWELTENGVSEVVGLGVPIKSDAVTKVASKLRKIAEDHITSAQTKSFVLEAIACHEEEHHRAAVVLSWIGAANLLYEYVFANKLAEFNAEAKRRNAKWKDAKSTDDFTNMKEYDFLQVAHAISVIGKSVKTELEQRLKFRNGCGHPNSLKISDSAVAHHIEILLLNVFEPFGANVS
ncbi:hypothetical protein V5T82_10850 [Magnetovibrio sp. PR-2]|uniref:hypothetical protein n=1 Tax=Magnetovibrio sp. PR-2 TaxID=3120356 RepID=UPI002FCDEA6F